MKRTNAQRIAAWRKRNPERSIEINRRARAKASKENPLLHHLRTNMWRMSNPHKIAEQRWKQNHGIDFSYDNYKKLFKKQKGTCAVCKCKETKRSHVTNKRTRLSLDMCGDNVCRLLCMKCLWLTSRLKKNKNILKALINPKCTNKIAA